MLATLSYVAETERTKIRQRQREGIDLALAEGLYKGRPKVQYDEALFIELYSEWKSGRISARNFMDALGLKSQTFYRRVREFERTRSS